MLSILHPIRKKTDRQCIIDMEKARHFSRIDRENHSKQETRSIRENRMGGHQSSDYYILTSRY